VQTLTVTLPTVGGPTAATLYYERPYGRGEHCLDLLHLIRQWPVYLAIKNPSPDNLEENYWRWLDGFRQRFSIDCAKAIGNVDLIVDPPSTRGYHRPYLSSFKHVYPQAFWLMFGKTTPSHPNPIELLGPSAQRKEVKAPDMHNILIVDDVFATGATAARIVDFLSQKALPNNVRFHIAAPLLIPAPFMQKAEQDKILQSDLPPLE
jgi:hypothetical protein